MYLRFFKILWPPSILGLKKMFNALVTLLLFTSTVPLPISSMIVHYTSYGGICTGPCGFHGYDYTWCEQNGGSGKKWDYCSLELGVDSKGQNCATSCDLWGSSYHSCYFLNGKWNYCGLIGHLELVQYSEDNHICITACRAPNGSFQCNTIKGTERCSPFQDVTPMGLPCHNNYRCAKYGHSVYRCHTGDSEGLWDHCGRKSLEPCVFYFNSSETEICSLSNSQRESQIIFRREKRNYRYPFAKAEFKRAVHLIDKINSIISLPDPGPLASVHISKKESIFCKGVNYTNVEMKVGHGNETSLPIAHVLFSENLQSDEILRLALYSSLHSNFYPPAYTIAVSIGEAMQCPFEPRPYFSGQD